MQRDALLPKAPGPDLIIGESLWVANAIHGEFLAELRKACGRLAYVPKIWSVSTVSSIFKKDDAGDPANYRPIALLSHPRKVIESAIDSTKRQTYKFHCSQYELQRGMGTESATLRATELLEKGFGCSTILDLNAAPDRVPGEKLSNVLDERLPQT